MKNTINALASEASEKYTLDVRTIGASIIHKEVGRNDVTSTHYPTAEQFFIGLINLADTGYASLPK